MSDGSAILRTPDEFFSRLFTAVIEAYKAHARRVESARCPRAVRPSPNLFRRNGFVLHTNFNKLWGYDVL